MADVPEIVRCPPVLICGFARPDTLVEVFKHVREVRPSRLYLWLNHPREDRPDEVRRHAECVKIFDGVDWPCEVFRNYSSVYLTCRNSLEGAFTWLFDNEDRGIILEDDCVPEPTFFRFCGELLEKYKDDGRVGMISGHDENLRVKQLDLGDASYYFDRLSSIWGWATWRRAWRMHDKNMSKWPGMKTAGILRHVFYDKAIVAQWEQNYDENVAGLVDTWDNAWMLTVLRENWLVAHPRVNLISNLGCGKSMRAACQGKTASQYYNPWDRRPVEPMHFPLVHPLTMIPNIVSERWTMEDVHLRGPLLKYKVKKLMKNARKKICGALSRRKRN